MKCPHCGRDVDRPTGAEVIKCRSCGRWMEVVTSTTDGTYSVVAYSRPKRGLRGGWATTPTSVERLVELLRSLGYVIPFRAWTFERLTVGHWQRSAGAWVWRVWWLGCEVGSTASVAQCLRDSVEADIET